MFMRNLVHGGAEGSTRRALVTGTTLIRCALALALVLGALLGYWASVSMEQSSMPGVRGAVQVTALSQRGLDNKEVLSGIDRLASDAGTGVYVVTPTPSGRTVYVAGEDAAQWIDEGFRGLPGSGDVEILPLDELPYGDYRRVYEFSGVGDFSEAFQAWLSERGVEYTVFVNQKWTFLLSGTAIGALGLLGVFFSAGLTFVGVILNSRMDAVRRLHGYSLSASFGHELTLAARRTVVPLLGLMLAADILLALWANPLSARELFFNQLLFSGAFLLICAGSLIFSLLIIRAEGIVALLAGKLPHRQVFCGMYAARLGALVAVATLAIAAVNHTGEWRSQVADESAWSLLPEAYSLALSGSRDRDAIQVDRAVLAQEIRALSAQDRVFVALFEHRGSYGDRKLDRDVVVYNESAARVSLRGAAYDVLQRIGTLSSPVWLYPSDATSLSELPRIVPDGHPEVARVPYQSGSSTAHSWDPGVSAWMNRALVQDPYVLVLPNRDLALTDRTIVAEVTQESVFLTDYQDYLALQRHPEVGSFVLSAQDVRSAWGKNHQDMKQLVWAYSAGLLAALVLAAVISLAGLFSLLKIFHQRLRVSYIHGVAPRGVLAAVGVAEVLVLILLAAYLWSKNAAVRDFLPGGSHPGEMPPDLLAMLSVPSGAWWLTLLVAVATALPVLALVLRRYSIHQLIDSRR